MPPSSPRRRAPVATPSQRTTWPPGSARGPRWRDPRRRPWSAPRSVTISATRPSRVSATRVTAAIASAISATPATSASHLISARGGQDLRPQATHASKPAVIVAGLALEELGDLGVGKDQEPLVGDASHHRLRDGRRLERAAGEEVDPQLCLLARQHVGLHALRAQAGDTNPP